MDLQEQIKEELKDALKAQDAPRLRTIRSMLTAFTNELVSSGKTPQDPLDDAKVLSVIKKLAKHQISIRKASCSAISDAKLMLNKCPFWFKTIGFF